MSEPHEATPAPVRRKRRRGVVPAGAGRRLKWRAEAAAFVAFEAVLGLLPLTWVAKIGRTGGHLAYKTLSRRRRAVLRNLRIAFAGEKPDAELRELTAEVFRRTGANLLCSLRTVKLRDDQLDKIVEIRDADVLQRAAAPGRGVVVLLAHMGNWEALAQWLPRILPPGARGGTVYRPLNNPILNERVEAARRRRGLELFSKRDNPLSMASFIRANSLLSVLADQRAGEVGELVPFFGRWTSCTPIPAILARRTGAGVVGISLTTTAVGRWELRFHELAAGEVSTSNLMGLVEQMIRVSPADVFWLQDRWKVSARRPQVQAGKAARGQTAQATKRRRVLLWAGRDGVLPEPPAPSPDDVAYEVALPESRVAEVNGVFEKRHGYAGEDRESVTAFLDTVDRHEGLPLEYVVARAPSAALRKACARLGIALAEAAG